METSYVVLLPKDLTFGCFRYTPEALNVPPVSCIGGWLLCFFSVHQLSSCRNYTDFAKVHYICDVTLPEDARVHHEIGISKADRIVLGPLRRAWADSMFSMAAVQQTGWALKYVEQQTPEICMAAVKQTGWALRFVQEQTREICMAAVQQQGWALEHVQDQTPEICLAAVQENGYALKFVRKQTPEVCLAAVQRTVWALEYVREQTPEMCLAAVQQDGMLLEFVKEQTREICMAAVQQDGRALKCVRYQFTLADAFFRECLICCENMHEHAGTDGGNVILQCRHAYHKACLRAWARRSNKCPCCRAPSLPNELGGK